MHSFDEALNLTIESLRSMRAAGQSPVASSAALQALCNTRPPCDPSQPTSNPSPRIADSNQSTSPSSPPSTSAPSTQTTYPVSPEFEALRQRVLACSLCPHLASSRTTVVFGEGNPSADLMFVGEAPGADEDKQGVPFVGLAGQLLDKIILAMGFPRQQVFIANVLKCRPDTPPGSSGNRPPTREEMATCLPYLREQIALVKPRVIVALGAVAMKGLFGEPCSIGSARGRWHDLNGIPVMPTFHPAYLLRNQATSEKRKVWEDMLCVLEFLEIPITPKQRKYFTSPH